MNADQRLTFARTQLTNAALNWYRTEREVIADKSNAEKQQNHQHARMVLREASNRFIRASTPT